MKDKYVIYTKNGFLENVLSRDEAIEKIKQYHEHGVDAYIISETEAKRIQEGDEEFHLPKWE
ncbi:hypothetical protein [Natronincola ferrireducens]|uniref:Uncharacterized protein n=1 Tax=Natronincola ferrireducens TaxID=393762 RepID=A0A1G8ZL98_9FIRM|nr:hypothetical protein [Natronincola ferrireducens]SDK15892.1 hypothetical protein SAMN05660472_00899 [Natronincola ferrireducens]